MPIVYHQGNIAYFSVPKCACSSLKLFFFQLEKGISWREAPENNGQKRIHNVWPSVPFKKVDLDAIGNFMKIAVVRAPVTRLLSCYKSKVQHGNVLREDSIKEALVAEGLSDNPDFDEFVAKLRKYRMVSPIIRRHSQPLSFWLGPDASIYDRLYDISELNALQDLVAERSDEKRVRIPHKNKSASPTTKDHVSSKTQKRINKLYKEDIDLYGHVFNKD